MSALAVAIPFPCRAGWTWGPRTGFPLPAEPCRCARPLTDTDDPHHCLRCGHDGQLVIEETFRLQAFRTQTPMHTGRVAA